MVNTYYDQISEGYEELHREEQEKKMNIILSLVKVKPKDSLLDVGCGTGITAIPWKCKRTGIDPAKKLLAKAHEKEQINYVLAAAEKIPFPDHSFDIVTSVTAIQNFSDIKKGLSEIKRIGKEKFVLTYLKKSSKAKIIETLINKIFKVTLRIEEEKDIIFIIDKI